MLIDANLLLCAASTTSPFHAEALHWLDERLNGRARMGIPWACLLAFLRIATAPRAMINPLTPVQAVELIHSWLGAAPVWIPQPTDAHAEILGSLMERHHVTADLVSDAHLAALAIEHGLTVYSADTDFARFGDVRWENPLRQG